MDIFGKTAGQGGVKIGRRAKVIQGNLVLTGFRNRPGRAGQHAIEAGGKGGFTDRNSRTGRLAEAIQRLRHELQWVIASDQCPPSL